MDPSDTYDLVVIGGGPAGYTAGIRAGQLGLKVAVVDSRRNGAFGGTCLNVGCIPAKALLNASELFDDARTNFKALGIEVDPKFDLTQMHAQKTATVTSLAHGIEYLFKKYKVDGVHGFGRIVGTGQVEVTDFDGATRTLGTTNILIATGSEPASVSGVAYDQARVVDSEGALELEQPPAHLVVIGGGVIGLELGSVWRRLGSQVTVVEYLPRIIPGADGDVAVALQRILTKQGLQFRLGTKVVATVTSDACVTVTVAPANGGAEETLSADVVLVAVGRLPFTAGLGLETVGIETDRRGFIPHEHYKTTAPGVWAVGDVTTGPMLAHKAEDEAVAAVELIAGKAGHVNYNAIPSVIYTHPEVAWVGKTEDELKAAGVAYKVGKFPFTANPRAKINHETDGFVKVIADAATDRVLGAHMVGPQVGEMIAEYTVAIELGATAEDIARVCHPHPTRSEALRQAAMGVGGWTMQL